MGKTEELARAFRYLHSTRNATATYVGCERCKNGYKLFFLVTQYGVDIVIFERFCNVIEEIDQFDTRLKKLTIISADRTFHFFIASDFRPDLNRRI